MHACKRGLREDFYLLPSTRRVVVSPFSGLALQQQQKQEESQGMGLDTSHGSRVCLRVWPDVRRRVREDEAVKGPYRRTPRLTIVSFGKVFS